jgi:hypothetical protein
MRRYIPILFLVLTCAACAEKFEHDPNLAASKAEEFAQLAFVRKEYDAAYQLLADSTRRYLSADQFKQTLMKSQPEMTPRKITPKEYEPMSGEKAIYIYLTGDDTGGSPPNYRITLEGTAATGYKVLRFDRGAGLNLPGSERKKLPG